MKKKLKIKQECFYTFVYKVKFLQIRFNWPERHSCQCCGAQMKRKGYRVRHVIEILPNCSFPCLIATEVPIYYCSFCKKHIRGSLQSSSGYGNTIKKLATYIHKIESHNKKISYNKISYGFLEAYKLQVQTRAMANWERESKLKGPHHNKGTAELKRIDGFVVCDEVRGVKACAFLDEPFVRLLGDKQICKSIKQEFVERGIMKALKVTKPLKTENGRIVSIIKNAWEALQGKLVTCSAEFSYGKEMLDKGSRAKRSKELKKLKENYPYYWVKYCKKCYSEYLKNFLLGKSEDQVPLKSGLLKEPKYINLPSQINLVLASKNKPQRKLEGNKLTDKLLNLSLMLEDNYSQGYLQELIMRAGKGILPDTWIKELYPLGSDKLKTLSMIRGVRGIIEDSRSSIDNSYKMLREPGENLSDEDIGTLYSEAKSPELKK